MSQVVVEVIDRHVEEAAILWSRRDRAIGEPHFSLVDLARLDANLDAHIDGMRVADLDSPNSVWRICGRELHWHGPGEVFAAAMLALECSTKKRIAIVTNSASHCYDCSRAFISSLGWISDEQVKPLIDCFLVTSKPFLCRIGVAACAVRKCDPGEVLERVLSSRDKLLKARALRALGELARCDLLPAAKKTMDHKDPHIRYSAAWSVARLSEDERARDLLRKTVESQSADLNQVPSQRSDQHRALQLVLRRMPPHDATKWINQLATKPELLRQAVIGTGVVGVPESIPWLLQLMQPPALARVAGEAFTTITGLDLAGEKFDAPWPAGFTAGPSEDPADNNVAMDEDENLPWPEARKLTDWWQKHASEFQPGTRYLCGQPLSEDWLEHVLRYGYQRQRAAAALELALLRPDQPLFNVRAPGHRQQELLGLR